MALLRSRFMAFLRRKMISCEEASMLSTREVIEGVSARDRAHLLQHLSACKGCGRYYEQIKLIHEALKSSVNSPQINHRLSNANKTELRKVISNRIKSI